MVSRADSREVTGSARQSAWMLFASFVFAIMGVCVKLASDLYSTAEIVMFRGGIGVLFLSILITVKGGTFATKLPLQHLWRGAVGVTALWLWFYSIGKLPLATAVTLNYTAPIWIAAILFISHWWHGKKRFEWWLVVAIALSFVGVTLLLQPSFDAGNLVNGLIALLSGFLSAWAYMQVRRLGQLGEPEYRVVFYFSLTGLVAGLLGSLVTSGPADWGSALWHPHSGKGLALLAGIGISATVAQMAMTRAYRLGKMLVTANLQYTGIVFSSIWGILIWGDLLSWIGWLGIAIILASGMAATFYNARTPPASDLSATAETPATDPIAAEV